jgi:hypothetical protein
LRNTLGQQILAQYIGSAGDTVTFSATFTVSTIGFQNEKVNKLRSQTTNPMRDRRLNALIKNIQSSQPKTVTANSNGVANLVLWTQGLDAGTSITVTTDLV